MDVDVDQMQRDVQEQQDLRTRVAHAGRPVGFGDRPRDGPVAHRAPVDEQPQRGTSGRCSRRRACEPANGRPGLATLDRRKAIRIRGPEHLMDPRQEALHRRRLQDGAAAGREHEPDVGPAQRQERQCLRHVRGLGRLRTEELPPRRHGPEEVTHLDGGAARMAGRPRMHEPPVFDLDLGAGGGAGLARAQHQVRDAGHGGQGLAAEAVGGHALEVGQVAQLRGGVPLQRAARVLRAHAVAVVADADQFLAPGHDLHGDRGRLGVEGVLDQLLHDRSRPLHDLARRDLVDEIVGQPLDPPHIHCFRLKNQYSPPVTPNISSHTNRYPYRQCSSGMCSKFIP
jgi:hypothetical protein